MLSWDQGLPSPLSCCLGVGERGGGWTDEIRFQDTAARSLDHFILLFGATVGISDPAT